MRWSALYPPRWRERYGSDIDEEVRHSARPLRARLDAAIGAVLAWRYVIIGDLGRHPVARKAVRLLAFALVCAGTAGGGWARGRLAHGLFEIPGHWWSSLAVAPAVIGLAVAVFTFGSDSPRTA
jgi:hypothetical protein